MNRAYPRSAALRGLCDHLNEAAGSEAGQAEEETFAALPENLFSVKSLTLAVNLDSVGHAYEAGIVALHGEPFGRDRVEPLVHPDQERYDLTVALNRELMGCVDRVLTEELTQLGADLDGLRRAGVSDTLVREIQFVAEVSGSLLNVEECGIKQCFGMTVKES